ncbi:MAG: hypothetical protein NLN65_03325 [Candidatus Poseidoniaceae archaeon]|nr:hypothetical protein [Candidatus Poseidoniaceae archaeon]
MQSWDTVEEVDEEMDIFAELGAVQTVVAPVQSMNTANGLAFSDDPLAAFMEDEDEETLTADSLFGLEDEPDGAFEFISEPQTTTENTSGPVAEDVPHAAPQNLSNEVITELLEVLVKTELNSRIERGENWLSGLSADAVAKIESAKVVKQQEAYHLSLIIEMVGTGQVRPFATVLSTGEGVLPVSPPTHLSNSWHPLYNALRDLLLQAMNSLSKVNVVVGKAAI